MQKSRPFYIYVPSEVQADIEQCFKKNLSSYFYIVHSLINKVVHDKEMEFYDYTPFNVKKLKRIIPKDPKYYIKNLDEYDILVSDKESQKGVKSYHYKLNPKYHIDCNVIEIAPEDKLHPAINNQFRNHKKNLNKNPPHLCKMANKFMNLEYDFDGAYGWINTIQQPEKRLLYSMAVEQLRDKRTRYFNRNNRNKRLDTNLTNLKKELRSFVKEDLVSIDLKNSQPFFLSLILNQIINNTNNRQQDTLMLEVENLDIVKTFGRRVLKKIENVVQNGKNKKIRHFELLETTSNGIFYETFINKLGEDHSRDEVKQIMFGVLYSRNVFYENRQCFIPYKEEKRIFSKAYPIEYEIIKLLKESNHEKLAVFMQKVESYIFIDVIAKRLVETGIIPFTIHDSVIVEAHQWQKALEIIKEVFEEKTGRVPSFDIERLDKYQHKQPKEEEINEWFTASTGMEVPDPEGLLRASGLDFLCDPELEEQWGNSCP